jgi:hypothetical protein
VVLCLYVYSKTDRSCSFTPRGIVALVFSVISAFLGIAAISWQVSIPKPEFLYYNVTGLTLLQVWDAGASDGYSSFDVGRRYARWSGANKDMRLTGVAAMRYV